MNKFEFFKKKPTPEILVAADAEKEPMSPFQTEWNRQKELIDEAKAKYEGIILYSPLEPEIKEKITTKLDSVLMKMGQHIELFADMHQGPKDSAHDALRASLWVDREMRGFISSLESEMDENNHKTLTSTLENLTIPEENRVTKTVTDETGWKRVWKE